MRYCLRSLLIVMALGPAELAGAWFAYQNLTEPDTKPAISEAELDINLGTTQEASPLP